MSARRPGIGRRPLHRLNRLLAGQLVALVWVAAYLLSGGEAAPDHGLTRIGALTLDEHVPGLNGTGKPALVILAGRIDGPAGAPCRAEIRRASARRGRADGIAAREVDFVVLVPDGSRADLPGVAVRPDPRGALARRLALPRAATGCHPGYVVLDPSGAVRYRTYDDGWAHHAREQTALLEAVR